MNIKIGNMWSCFDTTDHFLITTNAIVKADGCLVMGRGIAKQCRDKFANIDFAMGRAVQSASFAYGIILGAKIGLFQVKYHWQDDAKIELIKMSADMLSVYARKNPNKRIDLNFPGIGNGKLAKQYDEVLETISVLPDNVNVWKYK